MTHGSPQQIQQRGAKRKITDRGGDYVGGDSHTASTGIGYQLPMLQRIHQTPKTEDEDTIFDPITHGVMTPLTAKKCWDRYTTEMCYHLPIVVFPAGTGWEDLRKAKPILFLSVVPIGSGTVRPELQSKPLTEVTQTLADRVIVQGETSFELVQTIRCMTTFYQPSEKNRDLNFNQLIHIAAVMALDIGLGKRIQKGKDAQRQSYTEQKLLLPDLNSVETRRCWLSCYFMCSNSSMALRRPLLIRWSPYIEECVDILDTAPDAAPTDKWFCVLVRGQHIAENVGLEFSMDDPAFQLSLTDHRTQCYMKAFERQLSDWHDFAPARKDKPHLNT